MQKLCAVGSGNVLERIKVLPTETSYLFVFMCYHGI